jgi:hypothetical protein
MTDISTIARLRTTLGSIGEHTAKPTALTAGLTEATEPVWAGGRIETGLWECTPGRFTARRDGYTEICTILYGSVTITQEGQDPIRFGPGDVMVMPSGWVGEWDVHEPLRKHYTVIDD